MQTPPRSGGEQRVAVVGGGWSGIATAWYLHRRGIEAELLDSGSALGGRSASGSLAGREITFGGKNIGHAYAGFREFAREMGDPGYEAFGINSSRIENGRLRSIDSEHRLRSTLGLLRGLPPRDLKRIVQAALQIRRDPEARYVSSTSGFGELAERHNDPPLDDWFGPRACEVLARPMTVRMSGAEPREMYLGTFGTNIGAVLDTYDQLSAGFSSVFDAFSSVVPCELGVSVEALVVEDGAVTGLRVRRGDDSKEERRYAHIVLAVPAWAAAPLVDPVLPAAAEELRAIRYFPAAVVLAKYSRPVFSERIRALLLGPDSPVSNAGAYGASDRDIVRFTVSGGQARSVLASFDAESVLADAERRLGEHIPVSAAEREDFVSKRWEHALCAYSRHHARRTGRLLAATRAQPGLDLTGDYLRSGTIEGCFRAARECADQVARAPWVVEAA